MSPFPVRPTTSVPVARPAAGSLRRLGVVLAGLVLAAPLAACGDDGGGGGGAADVPGVTDTEVVVGTHMPLTGPAAPGYSKIAPATKAYFDFVNAAGGVHGRKITYKIMDDGYDPSRTQAVVRELVLQDKVFALLNGLGTPTHTGVLDFLNTNRVPDLFVASGSRNWNQPDKYPRTFGFQTDYTVEGKILGTYIKQNHAGSKVCHFGQKDDFGGDSLAGIEKAMGAAGLAAKETYVPTNTNIAPQIGKLKAAGCQVIVLATVPGFTALTLGTAARAGLRAQWVVSSVGGDYLTLTDRLTAKGAPLLEGLVSAGYLVPLADETEPWNVLFRKINKEHNGDVPFDGNVLYGMSVGYTFVQALQAAGKDLTRERIVEVIEQGKLTGGPGLTPFRYSADDHSGYSGLQLGRITGGKQVPFGPVYVTDDKDAPVTESDSRAAAPPANGVPS
jgi:ABC-type branched-subunit amino acid transport system substrate-binding protein